MLKINFRSYADLHRALRHGLWRIPPTVDLVVGIPRSGVAPAAAIASHLSIPFMTLSQFVEGGSPEFGQTRTVRADVRVGLAAGHVLLVDDSIALGRAMGRAREAVAASDFKGQLSTLAVYSSFMGKRLVDLSLEVLPSPRVFEWNILNHWLLEHSCVDIDGVLCQDPTLVQRVTSHRFGRFAIETSALIRPKYVLSDVVTSRQEKYRGATEHWLGVSGIRYRRLHMMPNASAVERFAFEPHAEFKGRVFRQSHASLFIESDSRQAARINQIAGKPVLAWDIAEVFDSQQGIHLASRFDVSRGLLRRVVRTAMSSFGRTRIREAIE